MNYLIIFYKNINHIIYNKKLKRTPRIFVEFRLGGLERKEIFGVRKAGSNSGIGGGDSTSPELTRRPTVTLN